MRKLITALLIVAMLSLVPVLAGCGDKLHTHTESTTVTTEQHTVVE